MSTRINLDPTQIDCRGEDRRMRGKTPDGTLPFQTKTTSKNNGYVPTLLLIELHVSKKIKIKIRKTEKCWVIKQNGDIAAEQRSPSPDTSPASPFHSQSAALPTLLMSSGARLPGMRAVEMRMSISLHCLANSAISASMNSFDISLA